LKKSRIVTIGIKQPKAMEGILPEGTLAPNWRFHKAGQAPAAIRLQEVPGISPLAATALSANRLPSR